MKDILRSTFRLKGTFFTQVMFLKRRRPKLSVTSKQSVPTKSPIYESKGTKLCTYAKLNCLKYNCFWHLNCVLLLNWIVLNRTAFDIETVYFC